MKIYIYLWTLYLKRLGMKVLSAKSPALCTIVRGDIYIKGGTSTHASSLISPVINFSWLVSSGGRNKNDNDTNSS